jgi:hypothetical protein
MLGLAGLVLVSGGLRSTPAAGATEVVARTGTIVVSATSLEPGPDHAWVSNLQVRTSASDSDQLDAALAAGETAVGVFHQRVSVGEIPDLASCDSQTPPASVVNWWLHYGPLLVPGRNNGPATAATATLNLPAADLNASGGRVPVTLYFAHAGQVIVDLPLDRS